MSARVVCLLLLLASCRAAPSSGGGSPADTEAAPARPLAAGEIAPEFAALAQTGHRVALSSFLHKPVAVYHCPAGLDEACTELVIELRDQWLRFHQKLGMVLVVTPSGYAENLSFSTEHELPLLLVADSDGAIAKSYGIFATPGGTAPARRGFLIGTDRKIRRVFTEPSAEHVRELVALE